MYVRRSITFAALLVGCGLSDSEKLAPYDDDDDGFYAEASTAVGFEGPYDCDDTDPAAHPGADEVCGGGDEDCDGEVNETDAADAPTWYADADLDGYGDPAAGESACEAPPGYVADASDCDAADAARSPDTEWFVDGDKDGVGAGDPATVGCEDPGVGFSDHAGDCDDTRATVSPDADENIANGIDEDCSGGETCFEDSDFDTYGSNVLIESTDLDCTDPGEADRAGDCDDVDSGRSPGNVEIPADSYDQDCDGYEYCYYDGDKDGFGLGGLVSTTDSVCQEPTHAAALGDCDDRNAAASPAKPELCSTTFDDDCDGQINELGATGALHGVYRDADGDGHGAPSNPPFWSCELPPPVGYVELSDDCNDASNKASPAIPSEIKGATCSDGLDNDCDGKTDIADTNCQ